MKPLNYAQKALLWFAIFSSLLTSFLWMIGLELKPFNPRDASIIFFAWLVIVVGQVMLAMIFGKYVGRESIIESSLEQKLRDLEGNLYVRERERKLVQDHLLEAIVIVDEENKIISVNRAAKKLIGRDDEIRELSLAEIFREPEVHELIQNARHKRLDASANIKLGAINPINVHAKVAPMIDGKMMLSLLDARQLHGVDDSHDDFITHASHELKTPVAIILANSEILIETVDDKSDQAKLLHAIHRQAQRAKNLLEALIDLLRFHVGRYPVQAEEIEVSNFVDEVKASLGHMGSMITNNVDKDVRVITDRALFERLALIIVENAQKYAGKNPRLIIDAKPQGTSVKIQFIDNGPGIKSHLRERVFEQFFRQPEHEQSDKEGFGLGLSHARAIATALGGRIYVDEKMKNGCAVNVILDAVLTPQAPLRSQPVYDEHLHL